ncbi:MAG: MBL fold metallo-hydrolase [Lachnospiraceae bacterium]|nr:MBL fold metallo-hydrolase [Lachnospiraceae bacterium]
MARGRRKRQKRHPVLAAMIFLLLGLAGYRAGQSGDFITVGTGSEASVEVTEALTVHFIDVGQGDCTLITQGGHAMLIDAGDNSQGENVVSYLNYAGVDELDYLILTHPDADHIGGADVVLYNIDCEAVLAPDKEADTKSWSDVVDAMSGRGLEAVHPQPGDSYTLGEAAFTVLGPLQDYEDSNDCSIVLRLTHGDNSFLFTGDAEETAEADILSSGYTLSADVLKVGHHGSRSSTSDDFLAAISPSCAVISCGEGNDYGHPHAATLNKLRASGVSVYRTDEQGTIAVTSDGSSLSWNMSPSETWQTGE